MQDIVGKKQYIKNQIDLVESEHFHFVRNTKKTPQRLNDRPQLKYHPITLVHSRGTKNTTHYQSLPL